MLYSFQDKQEVVIPELISLLETRIQAILKTKKFCLIAIPGGRSILTVFQYFPNLSVDWSRIHLFFVDERVVPLEDTQSNYALAKESFAQLLWENHNWPKGHLHAIEYSLQDPHKIAAHYTQQWQELQSPFDILLFGAGEDGHIASLFPQHANFSSPTYQAQAFIPILDSPKAPAQRITVTPPVIQAAALSIVLFLGKEKQSALQAFQNTQSTLKDCPALLTLSSQETWLVSDIDLEKPTKEI